MNPSTPLPSGIVTFLLTDIEGSTRLWEQHPEAMAAAVARHDARAAAIIARNAGVLVKHRGEGDSLFAVFARPLDAIAAAADLQRALRAESWPDGIELHVRMALQTGDADLRDGDYFGPAVNRCARLRAAAHGGQVLLAAATADRARDALTSGVALRDLGECRLRDLSQPERVYQLQAPDLPVAFPPLRGLDTAPNNLTVQPTALLGRDDDVALVREMLCRERPRLVTLTGPGGTGKTRLALQVAADLLEEFPAGVFFVDLAPIRDPDLVAATIAQTLGVQESGGRPLVENLRNYLGDKQLLLVLDNFEQVLEAAPVVAELLGVAPRLKLLATSRASLCLRAEQEYPVPPLATPSSEGDAAAPGNVARYPAVDLFIQRAQAVNPRFAVTDENAAAIAEICRRLDGLPLAIELAAARIKLFTPEALLTRLEHRLAVLTGGARDLPERQQTLRSAIAWSYDLLGEAEQRLFRRLSVFVGGFTLEAVEAVCNSDIEATDDLWSGLTALVDRSLVRRAEGTHSEPRFRLLETIREFGLDRLAEEGEVTATKSGHTRFFLGLAEAAAPKLRSAEKAGWLSRLEEEHGNLRASLDWCANHDSETELRLTAALWWFWILHDHVHEGWTHVTRALSRTNPLDRTSTRAQALCGAGELAQERHDPAARVFLEESVGIWRECGDGVNLGCALRALGRFLANDGLLSEALPLFVESLSISQMVEDRWGVAASAWSLGFVALRENDRASARARFEESLALCTEIGDLWNTAWSLLSLGNLAEDEGNDESACRRYGQSLEIFAHLGSKAGMLFPIQGLMRVARATGKPERAVRLLGVTQTLRDTGNTTTQLYDDSQLPVQLESLRAALGDDAFAAAWAEGRALTIDQATAYALEE